MKSFSGINCFQQCSWKGNLSILKVLFASKLLWVNSFTELHFSAERQNQKERKGNPWNLCWFRSDLLQLRFMFCCFRYPLFLNIKTRGCYDFTALDTGAPNVDHLLITAEKYFAPISNVFIGIFVYLLLVLQTVDGSTYTFTLFLPI